MDVFISYSRKDRAAGEAAGGDVISRIRQAFQDAGISYWLDEEGIHSGETFAQVISRNIAESKVFLFISSVHSNASRWTCGEIATASSYDKRIIPFRIDASPYDPSVTIYLAALDAIDYPSNPDKAIHRLVKSVKLYLAEMEAEARRIEEEKRLLAEKKRLELERERIRQENAQVIAGLMVRQTELEGKINSIDSRIDVFLEEKKQLLVRLEALRSRADTLNDEQKREALAEPKPDPRVTVKEHPYFSEPRKKIPLWLLVALVLVLSGGLALGLTIRNGHWWKAQPEPQPQLQPVAVADTTVSTPQDTTSAESAPSEPAIVEPVITEKPLPQASEITAATPKPEEPAAEKPKAAMAVNGNESDFTFHTPSCEAGSSVFTVTPALTISLVEMPAWCKMYDNERPQKTKAQTTFVVHWEENTNQERSGVIRVRSKATKEVIAITIVQVESKDVTEARNLQKKRQQDSIAAADRAREEAKKKELEAKRKQSKLIYKDKGVSIVAIWDKDDDGNEYFITRDWITEAQWKLVMRPQKDIFPDDFNKYHPFGREADIDEFIKKLSEKSNMRCRLPWGSELKGQGNGKGWIKIVVEQ